MKINLMHKILLKHPHSCFKTNGKTKLSDIFSTIPPCLKNYGVYLIIDEKGEIVYIGKNGTIKQSGAFGNHTLSMRIMQGKSWLKGGNYKICWFVTIKKSDLDKSNKLKPHISTVNIPSVVECELLRTFYAREGCLPEHNRTF